MLQTISEQTLLMDTEVCVCIINWQRHVNKLDKINADPKRELVPTGMKED
jgi:hypothetical protein